MNPIAHEWNFDGLVGPTHNYSGLSFGNIASAKNQGVIANPRAAALQGLAKMKALHDRGWKQGVLAPQARPNIEVLRQLGFTGDDAHVLESAARDARQIFNSAMSASAMWAANAATVSPSANTDDKRVHFTVANLNNKFHRSMEHPTTSRILQAMFRDKKYFMHHAALPNCPQFGDEGAANHTRFCSDIGQRGVEFFVFGAEGFNPSAAAPKRFPARQTLEASMAVARLHALPAAHTVFAQQHPDVIDAGVFHNDVIAVGHRNLLFCHQDAFLDQDDVAAALRKKSDNSINIITVKREDVSVADAVSSYLFNSQLLSKPNGKFAIVVPEECRQNLTVWRYLQALVATGDSIDEALPLPSTTNLILRPGKTSKEALEQVDEGFYITHLMGFGFNGTTGDFSQGASGFWIKNGVRVFPVSEVTISSSFDSLWKNVDALGDDLDTRSSVQVPSFRVSQMTIAGR